MMLIIAKTKFHEWNWITIDNIKKLSLTTKLIYGI